MSRRQWIGLAGVLFGAVMLAGIFTSGTTPDSTGSGAVERYQEYWSDSGHQDRASMAAIILTYACPLLVALAAGLRSLLRRVDDGPLPSLVLAAGAASAALFGTGSALINSPGVAAAESGYQVDGNAALHLESIGYYVLSTAVMLGAAMAVAVALSNRRAHVLPSWTVVLAGLVGLAAVGSIFTAWLGFILLPVWAVVVGVCLLVVREPVAKDVRQLVDAH
ncbi:MAG: hypothetical protein JWM62_3062 [Frankiales bacterium]|jgi:hypothetical protein|nr:hypothetical protein [Frankiales bacterium]